jgi:endonuclease/exonuclease/phosphatase family metal-dependent hydrolase
MNMPSSPPGEEGDITPPVITVTSPGNQSEVFGAVSLSFTATDDNSIARTEIYIDGEIVSVRQAYNWNTMSVEDGEHTITFRARDPDVNWGEATVTVTVDNSQIPDYDFSNQFKIMAYNIEESGINSDWKAVVKEENPDILMLVETGNFDDNGNQQLRDVVQELNNYFTDEDPYSGFTAQDIFYSTSGEAVLSRYPVLAFYQIPVVTLDDATGYTVTHDFVDAVIDINGTSVHFIGMHLKAGGGDDNKMRRNYENEGIINYMDGLGQVPIVYLGDMNSYSPEDNVTIDNDYGYGPMTMLVDPDDPTFGQYASEVHNFTDVYRALYPDDLGYTYGHQYSALLGRIDYIIVNDFFTDKIVNSTVGDTAHAGTGSDHYCIDAFITWNGTGAANLTTPSYIEDTQISPETSEVTTQPQMNQMFEVQQKITLSEFFGRYSETFQTMFVVPHPSSHRE